MFSKLETSKISLYLFFFFSATSNVLTFTFLCACQVTSSLYTVKAIVQQDSVLGRKKGKGLVGRGGKRDGLLLLVHSP